jgi:general secretion pathway protein G
MRQSSLTLTRRAPPADHGFTLLELVVVLFVLGLLSALALPRLATVYDSLVAAYARDEVLAQLNGLSYAAFQHSQDFVLSRYPAPAQAPIPLILPTDWTLSADPPIRFRANGACSGGTVQVHYQKFSQSIALDPPFCHARLL